ncbi:MAG: FAD-dependent oxidoreductase [Lachnospiraceae bacterium]|nr:FAD-dependent oxidoreductase [Lachnospiraceae bacterium]
MIRITQIRLRPEEKPECLEKKIRKILKLRREESFHYEVVRRAIDARRKPEIYYSYTVDVSGLKEAAAVKRSGSSRVRLEEPVRYRFPKPGSSLLAHRPVIVGTGPAGLFCGYMLALHGYRPILLERGMEVEDRCREVESFWQTGRLNPECNVQFGEGGAGTFSDGKLNTLIRDKDGKNREVLSIFVKAGAPESILSDGKPHIGTDILVPVVKNIRQAILQYGGEVHFNTRVKDILVENGRVGGVVTETACIPADVVVLAIGHSARDTFEMLHERQVPMEAKAFAVGLRVEHPQRLIDLSQYGRQAAPDLPPASYKLTAQTTEGRGVYTFCMCPGGYVADASSEEGRLAVNGMSYSGRDGKNANSAVIVSVTPGDFGSSHPLGGIAFQRRLEEKAYALGQGRIPVEYYGDFKKWVKAGGKEEAHSPGQTEWNAPSACYPPQNKGRWQFAPVHEILPAGLNRAFVEGMEQFGRVISGFAEDHVLLSGVESRTSSPVRIHRDEKGQSPVRGIYPCGEGAGYAGGIMSAAMDGIRTAEWIAREYKGVTGE